MPLMLSYIYLLCTQILTFGSSILPSYRKTAYCEALRGLRVMHFTVSRLALFLFYFTGNLAKNFPFF